MKLRRDGVTLIEVLITIPLMAVMSVALFSLLGYLQKSGVVSVRSQEARIDAESALNVLAANLGSTVLISPEEGLLADADGYYRGLYGVDPTALSVSLPNCQHEVLAGSPERFSIVRTTMVPPRQKTEKLLRFWNEEGTGPGSLVWARLSYHNSGGYPFQHDGVNVTLVPEVLIADADGLVRRRYSVLGARHVITNREPYEDQETVNTYEYTELKLGMPKRLDGVAQSERNIRFLTDSPVYRSSTRLTCVGTNGSIVEIDEVEGTSRVIFDPKTEGYRIDRFEVTYLATKTGEMLSPTLFAKFPPVAQSATRNCINSARIRLELSGINNDQAAIPLKFEKIVFFQNFHSQRPAECI